MNSVTNSSNGTNQYYEVTLFTENYSVSEWNNGKFDTTQGRADVIEFLKWYTSAPGANSPFNNGLLSANQHYEITVFTEDYSVSEWNNGKFDTTTFTQGKADVVEFLKWYTSAPGAHSPFNAVVTTPTPTPTHTVTFTPTGTPSGFTGVTIIDENWKLVANEGVDAESSSLDFVYQDEIMARIVPHESGDNADKITSVPYNETTILSEQGIWTVMYPSPDMARAQNKLAEFNALGVDSLEKQLKFLYNGYPQTLIMPMTTGTSRMLNGGVDFGKLWKLFGESINVVFYYRNIDLDQNNQEEEYFPQVLIGTNGLRNHISHAEKIKEN